jgi:ubiquinone/menaquinone biosynthesis C-methylase UbiE
MSLIDIGCGLGSITTGLAEWVAPGEVVGIDLDDGAVQRARQLAEQRGVTNVAFQRCNVYDLPFPDNSFDAAFAHMLLMHLPNLGPAVGEMLRVLKPSGVVGISERAEESDLRINSNETIELAWNLFRKWSRARGSDLGAGSHLQKVLGEAGFDSIEVGSAYFRMSSRQTVGQFEAFFQQAVVEDALVEKGWVGHAEVEEIRSALSQWTERSDTTWQMAIREAIARKPRGT